LKAYHIKYDLLPVGTIPTAREVVVVADSPDMAKIYALLNEDSSVIIIAIEEMREGDTIRIRGF